MGYMSGTRGLDKYKIWRQCTYNEHVIRFKRLALVTAETKIPAH